MKQEKVIMRQRELRQGQLLQRVTEGQLPLRHAAAALGVGYRQAKRLLAKFRAGGPAALAHGNRGRCPPNRLPEAQRRRILALSQDQYHDCNDAHFTERLAADHGLFVSRDLVRRLRRGAGLPPKRRRRPKQHHGRRPRRSLFGAMMLWDGSPHRWFGPDRPPCCLMAAIDDATSRGLALRFEPTETSLGYLRLLDQVVRRYGAPASIYQDGHSALYRHDDHWSLDEQLHGQQEPTQIGQVLRELGIEPIRALSPQAKGRVERLFNTFQDRLVADLRLAGISDPLTANLWLDDVYLARHNDRFAVPAAKNGSLFRRFPPAAAAETLAFRYTATVGNDNAVRLGGLIIDVPPGPNHRGYAKARVEVRQLLDGSWRVYYQTQCIAVGEATELRDPLKARSRRPTKGVADWTWVYRASAEVTT